MVVVVEDPAVVVVEVGGVQDDPQPLWPPWRLPPRLAHGLAFATDVVVVVTTVVVVVETHTPSSASPSPSPVLAHGTVVVVAPDVVVVVDDPAIVVVVVHAP